MTIIEQAQQWGLSNLDHLGDGAYVGQSAEGIALFTSNGVSMTRPVFLDPYAWKALLAYGKRTLEGE